MHRLCFLVGTIAMGVGCAAHAGSLDSLRATLAAMHAVKPLSASIHMHDHESSGKQDAPKVTDASVTVHIDDTARGLNLRFPATLLARANAEARAQAKNPDASAATHGALTSLDPTLIHDLADVTPVLLNTLVGATLTAQKTVMRGGHSVDLMTFSIPSGVGAADKDALKHYAGYLKVWLGADGVPIAVQESRQYKGSKFFITFTFGTLKNYTLQRIGQRLVVAHYQRDQHSSGLGHLSHSEVDITLKPDAAADHPD